MPKTDWNAELCARCGEPGPDRRTIEIDCFYDLSEVSSKLKLVGSSTSANAYRVRVCKECRGQFMEMLRNFLDNPCTLVEPPPDPEANIPVRVMGHIVMMTKDQFDLHRTKY